MTTDPMGGGPPGAGPAGPRGRLLTFGEALGVIATSGIATLDLARGASVGVGGAEVNVAVGAARLGAAVQWTGRVGRDAVGDLVVARLRGSGVGVRAIRDDAFTGLIVRHQRTAELVHVDYHRQGAAGSRLTIGDGVADGLTADDVLHLTGITPSLSRTAAETCLDALRAADRAGAVVSFDVNHRRKLWSPAAARPVLQQLAERSDILFAGVGEAQLLLGCEETDRATLAERLTRHGPRQVVVKDGAHGCAAVIDGVGYELPAVAATQVDPVGAGDAFVAGFLAEHLEGAPPAVRLDTALRMGAYAVSVPGDCELLPSRRELSEAVHTDVIR